MKSGTSLFNKNISANLLKRCWPIWLCWFVFLIFMLPVMVSQGINEALFWDKWHMPLNMWMEQQVLESACTLAKMSFIVSIIPVMAMFSFLYNSRTCNMMCSLPVKREALFTTVWITGIIPLIAADLLIALITMAAFPGTVYPALLMKWFGIVAMGNIGFYGFGSFCAMLTGNLFILPLVYAVLNATAVAVEATVAEILNILVFGAGIQYGRFAVLSPFFYLVNNLHTYVTNHTDEADMVIYDAVNLKGCSYLVWFFAAGLVLSFLALLLFRKRRMETASDTVAIPVLKPVFKYCMAVGCALVASVGVYRMFFDNMLRGRPAALMIAALMVTGAFIGWFAAKMLIGKSLRVFRGDWKGFVIVAAACLIFVAAAESDITGYEKRLPDLSKVNTAEFSMRCFVPLKERQNIEDVYQLQKSIIENKKHHESSSNRYMLVNIRYIMEDGSTMARNYRIACSDEEALTPGTDIAKAHGIENSVEALLWLYTPDVPVTADRVYSAAIYNSSGYGDGQQKHPEIPMSIELNPEEAAAIYNECIIPDIKAGRIYDTWLEDLAGNDLYSGLDLRIDLISLPGDTFEYKGEIDMSSRMMYGNVYLSVPETAALTLERIAELAASK
ncbi:MAG: hypothetical protein IJJ22_01135 [Oscillospiraceae bacterium]|nr:hypothetical protein [Oscillospiraceae bacterium]